ncbi:uncharacterized protein PAC_17679 [Phialocephala subalpina]|uniref:Uncharacterized protein n=1 Tax=Phialocephala subalpina TaxID=576137 RepID=A0A1L7XRW7_9HELO|nr:uncharacterized protein PAC_17679 [Phialocephala subalpina]
MPKAARHSSLPRAEPYPATKPSPPNSAKKRTPSNKRALTEKSASENNVPVNSPAKSEKPTSFLTQPLEDEDEDGHLPIYDTCSTVRQKINALLGKDNTKEENLNPAEVTKDGKKKPFTKASFVRVLNDMGGECSGRSLDTFLKPKKIKTMGGAESPVYPAAYKFFEKKRVFEGKKKNVARLKVEENRPHGLPLRDPNKMYILRLPEEDPRDFMDEYGQ